jgi:serine/threonine-protein kinase
VTEAWSEKVEQGRVIRSDPPAGTTLKPDALVDLVVSKGPRPIPVRNWEGEDADVATEALEGRGLVVDASRTEYSDTVPEGHVIEQDPDGGKLFRGDTVTLVVSRGPELVEIPGGIIGSGVESAEDTLEALGFDVEVEDAPGSLGLGYVFSMDPDSGDRVPRGSTITLYLI